MRGSLKRALAVMLLTMAFLVPALAHAELDEALPILVRRFGPPIIAAEVDWRPPIGIHGPNELRLRFATPA